MYVFRYYMNNIDVWDRYISQEEIDANNPKIKSPEPFSHDFFEIIAEILFEDETTPLMVINAMAMDGTNEWMREKITKIE